MREIKFRIWDTERNKMSTTFSMQDFANDQDGEYGAGNFSLYWQDYHKSLPVWKDNILMQFTGLKDKNDREIYEGDILIQYSGFGCEFSLRQGFVEWHDCAFWLRHKGYEFILTDRDCELEIIGNIYQNIELNIK